MDRGSGCRRLGQLEHHRAVLVCLFLFGVGRFQLLVRLGPGLVTDARARVLNDSGAPIPGLYAVGNDMASIMGGNYPSGGITLGPAMTFGYVAGRALADQPITGLDTKEDKETA